MALHALLCVVVCLCVCLWLWLWLWLWLLLWMCGCVAIITTHTIAWMLVHAGTCGRG